jgi:hypothetical protein
MAAFRGFDSRHGLGESPSSATSCDYTVVFTATPTGELGVRFSRFWVNRSRNACAGGYFSVASGIAARAILRK